jgi:NAD(P)-dependent dehydrogenase (short-subunit alcohol dehydrogenase family)
MANVWLIAAASRGMGVEFAKAVLASGRSVVASGRSRERVLTAQSTNYADTS